jgi:hypothetical protein
VFKFSLIKSYQTISLPDTRPSSSGGGSAAMEPVSYNDLRNRASSSSAIEIRMANGSSFRGKLLSITDDHLKMDVNGSAISFASDVISQIFILPASALQKKNDEASPAVKKPQGLLDSVWIKDGRNGQLYAGTITNEGDGFLVLQDAHGGPSMKFLRKQISRFVRHSAETFDEGLGRYAKPLSCPNGMTLIDLPPGVNEKPFFKVCIDKYEYPNRKGSMPRTSVSFDEACSLCAQQGKRLCTDEEWTWGCSGVHGLAYPYGKSFVQDRCNNDTRSIVMSGTNGKCVSPFGGYDMVGNIFEWVVTKDGRPALMGGPYSKCQTVSVAQNGNAKPQSGVRCCKSN